VLYLFLLLLKVDGCVTFYRRSKFIMVENYAIEFNDSAREAAASQGKSALSICEGYVLI
jgi:hypothetical protein